MSMLGIGLLLALVGGGLVGLGYALFGALLCACVPLVLFYATRGAAIGGGDVGLFGALGALLGPTAGLQVELASMVLLAVFALLIITWRGHLFSMLKRTLWLSVNWALPKTQRRALDPELMIPMRMGPAICVATWTFVTLEHFYSFLG